MAARLGTMRVNEQIDALDVMGVNTKQYLIGPRIATAVVCMPLLTAIFDFVAMVGSYFLVVYLVELDEAIFLQKIFRKEGRHLLQSQNQPVVAYLRPVPDQVHQQSQCFCLCAMLLHRCTICR